MQLFPQFSRQQLCSFSEFWGIKSNAHQSKQTDWERRSYGEGFDLQFSGNSGTVAGLLKMSPVGMKVEPFARQKAVLTEPPHHRRGGAPTRRTSDREQHDVKARDVGKQEEEV